MTAATTEAPEAPIEAPKPFTVTLNVRRYSPETDTEPYWEAFDVEMYPTDRILDALHRTHEQTSTARPIFVPIARPLI